MPDKTTAKFSPCVTRCFFSPVTATHAAGHAIHEDWSAMHAVTLNPGREISVPAGIKPGEEKQRSAA